VTTCAYLLLMSAALAAPATDDADEMATRSWATLARVSQLPTEQQRTWLLHLESRLRWAGKLSLTPAEIAREEKRIHDLLRQGHIPWETLLNLLRQLDQREKAAIARLVRQYRREVYDTFAKEPRTMIERQEAWYHVWTLWEKAGSPGEQQECLLDWLVTAIHHSSANAIGPLPADPVFASTPEAALAASLRKAVAEQAALAKVVGKNHEPRDVAKSATKSTPETVVTIPKPTTAEPEPQPLMKLPHNVPPHDVPLPEPSIPPPHVATVDAPRPPAPPALADHDAPTALAATPPFAPHRLAAQDAASDETRPLGAVPRAIVSHQDSVARITEPTPPAASVADSSPRTPLPSNVAVVAPANRLTHGGLEQRSTAMPIEPPSPAVPAPAEVLSPRRESAPQMPVVEPVPATPPSPHDVLAMLPEPKIALPVEKPRESVAEPAIAPPVAVPAKPVPPEKTGVQVDVEGLAVRVAGTNLALRTLEAELIEQNTWNAEQLDAALSRLDILVLRGRDLTLFRDLVTPAEQARVGRIEPPRHVISQLAARIAETRARAGGHDASAAGAVRAAELEHLDQVSQRLAELATEK
jgi:hypothetical protein